MAPLNFAGLSEPGFHTRFLCAFVQVPVSLLDFEIRGNHPREVDDRIKSRLAGTFTHVFEPEVPDNHVSGLVNEAEFESILGELQTTKEKLKQTLYSGVYPRIQNTRIWCPADRHRVEAALERFGDDTHWIVQLHCPPDMLPRPIYDEFVRILSERYSPRYSHSDGEIFRSIRRYEHTRPDLVNPWLARLSASKQISLNLLYNEGKRRKKQEGDRTILDVFDSLLVFPGLWEGLELGNLHKHLALRCNEEIVRFLTHIQVTWDHITNGELEIQKCVDINTARRLQSLAPAASAADRSLICNLVEEGQIFPGVQNKEKREQIKQRLLRTTVVIPSIKSFHENMKLFSIAMRIVRSYLLPERSRTPLMETLKASWKAPSQTFMEFGEGHFCTISSPPSFELAFKQVFLAAIRSFPELSDETPKIDPGDKVRATIQASTVAAFYRRAFLLGFRNKSMQERSYENERSTSRRLITASSGLADVEATGMDRRWGRPYARIFRQIRRVAFLPFLEQEMPMTTFPTVLYLQQDLVRAFLGSSTIGPRLGNPVISILDRGLEPIAEEMGRWPQTTSEDRHYREIEMNDGMESQESTAMDADRDTVMPDIITDDVQMADNVPGRLNPAKDDGMPDAPAEDRSQVPSLDLGGESPIGSEMSHRVPSLLDPPNLGTYRSGLTPWPSSEQMPHEFSVPSPGSQFWSQVPSLYQASDPSQQGSSGPILEWDKPFWALSNPGSIQPSPRSQVPSLPIETRFSENQIPPRTFHRSMVPTPSRPWPNFDDRYEVYPTSMSYQSHVPETISYAHPAATPQPSFRSVAPSPNFGPHRSSLSSRDSMVTVDLSYPASIGSIQHPFQDLNPITSPQVGPYAPRGAVEYMHNELDEERDEARTVVHSPERFSYGDGFLHSESGYWEL